MSEWNYGTSSTDKYGSKDDLTYIVNNYFKPYLKVAEDIGFKNIGYHILLSNGMTLSFSTVPLGTDIYIPYAIYIVVSNNKNTTAYGSVYCNYSRYDLLFVVSGSAKNTVYPFAYVNGVSDYLQIKSRDELINHPKYGCNEGIDKNSRYNCTALMLWDNWQIKDDYPW